MSGAMLIVMIVLAAVILIAFLAMMVSVMSSKRQTGHHGPRTGHADRKRSKRR